MTDLLDGQTTEMKGSGAKPYTLKNTGGAYSCSCPAWRNQTTPIEARTCKHLRKLRGDAAEEARCGGEALPQKPAGASKEGPPLLLAHPWDGELDVTGWWMSEKLDGVRAYWDGTQFISRLGNLYHAPDWFIAGMPKVALDGELWLGRGAFQKCISIVRRQDKGDGWKEIKFLVFDAPAMSVPFEKRMEFLRYLHVTVPAPYMEVLAQQPCVGIDDMRALSVRIEERGGEGLMLRQPGSLYEIGRSHTLLKVKSFKDDEARVLGTEPGKGKFKGMVGALLCELKNGKKFSVGTGMSNDERRDPPPVGAIITFKYQELTDDGIPRFPSYVGVREDLVYLSFEVERDSLPPRSELDAAFNGAIEGVLKIGEREVQAMIDADKFHAHLDVCARCRTKPFDLCPVGGQLLHEAVVGPQPPKQPRENK